MLLDCSFFFLCTWLGWYWSWNYVVVSCCSLLGEGELEVRDPDGKQLESVAALVNPDDVSTLITQIWFIHSLFSSVAFVPGTIWSKWKAFKDQAVILFKLKGRKWPRISLVIWHGNRRPWDWPHLSKEQKCCLKVEIPAVWHVSGEATILDEHEAVYWSWHYFTYICPCVDHGATHCVAAHGRNNGVHWTPGSSRQVHRQI